MTKKPEKVVKKKAAMNKTTMRIRMYQVGFGDCFLISTPDNKTILVDCGFHSQGKGAFSGDEIAKQVISDVVATSGKARIDVVVATHRHQDHVYAFNSKEWDDVAVGEVWMPWVENPKNVAARKLWKKQREFAQQLHAALPSFGLTESDKEEAEFLLWNAGVNAAGHEPFGAWSNSGALDRLIDGFAARDRAKPRYLPEGDEFPETFDSEALPGVRTHVLGPPRDPDLIAKLDPEADGETYRALALRMAEQTQTPIAAPFGLPWQVSSTAPSAPSSLPPDHLARLKDLARTADPMFAARALDDMINSTSLVLIMQIGKARLLLPGDAEWGTWKLILEDTRAVSLLKGTTFLKVGHHGSHNATPKTLLESVLKEGVHAMISTQEGEGNYRNNIPLPALLDALSEHGVSAVRSDTPDDELPDHFVAGPDGRWIDAILPC